MEVLESLGTYSLVGLLCLAGFALSCLSFSGTWLVLLAAGLASWQRWPGFPGIGTLVFFLLVCILVDVAESLAGAWGVRRAKGSKAAGWGAVVGGFLGMFLGGVLIPVPIVGSLLGMLGGSFGGAFWVEYRKMKRAEHAANVATSAVLARLGVMVLKVGATLGMILFLAVGLVL